jgi:hypothetical protein
MHILLAVLAIPVGLLILTKAIDMILFSIAWDMRYGRKYRENFHEILRTQGPKEAIIKIKEYGHNPMRICQKMSKFKPKWFFRPFSDYIYRWPTLTILGAIFFVSLSALWIKYVMLALVLLLILLELIHQLVSRLTLGITDNINKYAYFRLSRMRSPDTLRWHTSKILRDTVLTLLIQLIVFTVSYALIYMGFDRLNPSHFYPLTKSLSLLDSIYFSLVTLSTTGFGDIHAHSAWGKCLVLSEIVVIWTIIVLIIFHYGVSLTTRLEDVPHKN